MDFKPLVPKSLALWLCDLLVSQEAAFFKEKRTAILQQGHFTLLPLVIKGTFLTEPSGQL